MRAILENLRSGEIRVCDVPAPEVRPGGVLVRTAFSAISAGTERAKLETSEKSLMGKAIARPDLVRQVIDFARTNGFKAAYTKVKTKLDTLSPMGYSCAGEVIALGEGVSGFQIGDQVACAGGGYANHSELNWVPSNLAVRVPDSVALDAASLTTIGAISAQGLRQAQVAFGETVIVIGAGLVGILTAQLARAAGCRVIAIDLDEARVRKATAFGVDLALLGSTPDLQAAVREFSRYGGDAAIVTAATRSSEPVELAAQLLRDRGRIVVVGDVGMGVSRVNMYQKELKLILSRSYGPGRYDPHYEEQGHDYPIGYVRWTEKRNMEAFLDLLASRAINVAPLLENRYSVDEADKAYAALRSGEVYTAIIAYAPRKEEAYALPKPVAIQRRTGQLRIGCIGAGGFARAHLFPYLKAAKVTLESVGSASGIAAESARRNFGFVRAQTPAEIVSDSNLDAVFIATRHQSHAHYVIKALEHGKAVFVEKPLAVNRQELQAIRRAYQESAERGQRPFLMVGFNRRFAPATKVVRDFFAGRREPMLVHIRINAGFIPREHWTQQAAEGGRIVGELCHFVDWALHTVGASIRSVSAFALPDGTRYNRDNTAIVMTFADGSIANLLYLANGDPSLPKEYYEVFCEGRAARMEDFRTVELMQNRKLKRLKFRRDKGHRNEVELTLQSMASAEEALIPLHDLVRVTNATFTIGEALAAGGSVMLEDPMTSLEPVSPALGEEVSAGMKG
jgi:predicted dehydrogenase/threonine dehydrogenase-like Zn-dependent dehydrogenase